jgi:hypothetical protein
VALVVLYIISEATMRTAPTDVSIIGTVLSATRTLQSLLNSTSSQTQTSKTEQSRHDSETARHDLTAVIAFCLIGLLLSLNFMLHFPDLGAVIEQYNRF